jgi:hypothetical protein
MVPFHKTLATLALGLAVIAGAAPALAHGRAEAAYNGGGYPITAARAAALHECSAREAQYSEYDWGVTEIQVYRSCMAEHGQPE